MKHLIFSAVVVGLLVFGCKKTVPSVPVLTVVPSSTPTAVSTLTLSPTLTVTCSFTALVTATSTATATTIPSDSSTYPFETPADAAVFAITDSYYTHFSSMEVVSEKAFSGNGSLKIGVNFDGIYSAGVLYFAGVNLPMTGKTITAHIWVPYELYAGTIYAYGAYIYIVLPNGHIYQSDWLSLSTTIPGQWNTITASVNSMFLLQMGPGQNKTLAFNGEDGDTAVKWGINIQESMGTPDYNGFVYIDSINVE